MIYKARDGQTIFDLSMQLYGNLTSALRIVQDNLTILENLNSPIVAGMEINFTKQNIPLTNLLENVAISTTYPQIIGTGAFSNGFSDGFDN